MTLKFLIIRNPSDDEYSVIFYSLGSAQLKKTGLALSYFTQANSRLLRHISTIGLHLKVKAYRPLFLRCYGSIVQIRKRKEQKFYVLL